jgi:subtilisin family serine protease
MAKRAMARAQKLHPRLRMISNGDDEVNAVRALSAASLVSTLDTTAIDAQCEAAATVAQLAAPGNEQSVREARRRPAARKKMTPQRKAKHAYVGVFIEVQRDRTAGGPEVTAKDVLGVKALIEQRMQGAPGAKDLSRCLLAKRNFVAATVPVDVLDDLAADPRVAFVHPAEAISFDVPQPEPAAAPLKPTPRAVAAADAAKQGEGVLIGIIDVQGFDFAHPDFRASGGTRFFSIWDQRTHRRQSPSRRRGKAFAAFDFGSELQQADMNAAIRQEAGGVPATRFEPQSQMDPGSHGTHVASIAAGNAGVCPKAEIAAVLLDVPYDPKDPDARRATFTDSTRLVMAVEYLLEIARLRKKPISINISLGTNGGPHDGSGGVSRWFDALLATEGRSICVAAGNAGQEDVTDESPNGWMMGRIHASGRIPSRGLTAELSWVVVGDTIADVSENELEIWYSPQDRMKIAVKPPGATGWIEVAPREYVQNKRLKSGTFLSIYNELFNPVNGANYCAVYLSPDLRSASFSPVQAGTWTVRLTGEEIRSGAFHAWIERDDPFEYSPIGGRRVFRWPSFFSRESNVDSHAISSLACGNRVIAVANLDDSVGRIAKSSSQGPTRDDRFKPDIAAPGTRIVAANGFAGPEEPWVAMSGTSMASPYVTGVIGLMLAANPSLTAAQCSGILQRTAQPLPGASYDWRNDAGFGVISPPQAVQEAGAFDDRTDLTSKAPQL